MADAEVARRAEIPPRFDLRGGRPRAIRARLRVAGAVLACAALATVAAAQDEPDEVFRLPLQVGSARLVGLGGATVGLGGDVNAALSNPAALVSVPRTFDAALTLYGGHSQSAFGIAIRPWRKFAFGLLLWGRSATEDLVPATLEPHEAPALHQSFFTTPGFGVAYSPDRRYSLGAGCQWRHLSLHESGVDSDKQWGTTCLLGFFLQPDNPDGARLGIVYRQTSDVDFEVVGAPAHPTRLRQPDVVSAGASWRYDLWRNSRLVMSVQPELVLYDQLSAPGRDLHDDLDLRFGAELSRPFGCVTGCGTMAQLRASILSRAPVPYASFVDVDGTTAIQSPRRRNTWAVGASFAHEALFGGNLRLDVAYRDEDRTWIAGIAVRYPEAFRADLQHHRKGR